MLCSSGLSHQCTEATLTAISTAEPRSTAVLAPHACVHTQFPHTSHLWGQVALVVPQPLLGAGVEAPACTLKVAAHIVPAQVGRPSLAQPEVLQRKAHKLQPVPERTRRAVVLVAAAAVPYDAAAGHNPQVSRRP
jgi:hypothetical protein